MSTEVPNVDPSARSGFGEKLIDTVDNDTSPEYPEGQWKEAEPETDGEESGETTDGASQEPAQGDGSGSDGDQAPNGDQSPQGGDSGQQDTNPDGAPEGTLSGVGIAKQQDS